MNKTLHEILSSREDISDYVFHFTKGGNAIHTLRKIIENRAIIDIEGNGYICFSEAPLTMLPSMFDIFDRYPDPMYAPYGIGIKKTTIYDLGGKQVIYGDNRDYSLLPKETRWRFVHYNPRNNDYSWLREWRIQSKKVDLNYDNCFVVVKTRNDIDDMQDFLIDISDIDIDAQPEDGGVSSEYTITYEHLFRIISLEDMKEYNIERKAKLNEELSKQDKMEVQFYSQWE